MAVFTSERATGHRNRAIAHLMLNFGMIDDRLEEGLDLYFKQCSILVTCRDLAVMAATLANRGVNPVSGERALPVEYVRDVLSVMYTCGMYDFSGEWAYRVGLPAKSGVSGGILAVVPGQAGIGVFSPRLDARGNSVRGIRVCEELAERFGLHVFDCREPAGGLAAAASPHGPVPSSVEGPVLSSVEGPAGKAAAATTGRTPTRG
jgi:glutaminase